MPLYNRNQCMVIAAVTWSDARTKRRISCMYSAGNRVNRRTLLTGTSPGQTDRCTAFSLGDMSVN